MGVEIKPRRLRGPWADGYALHVHTFASTFIGNDEYGHPRFDTTRSPIGELLYQLKYRRDRGAVNPLAQAVVTFVRSRSWRPVDIIIPVPPSVHRNFQPVILVAGAVSEALNIPVCASCVTKVKKTPQLKDIVEYDKRAAALHGAFAVAVEQTKGKNLLLFDDVYGSGATVSTISKLLRKEGQAKSVYLLTLTTK